MTCTRINRRLPSWRRGGVPSEASAAHARHFTGAYERRVVPGAGHNLPQEAPDAFVAAVQDVLAGRDRNLAFGVRGA